MRAWVTEVGRPSSAGPTLCFPASFGATRPCLWLAALITLLALANPPLIRAAETNSVKSISVGVLTDNYPFSYAEGGKAPAGFAVELLAAIEQTMELRLERVIGTTQEINRSFQDGRLQMLQSFAQSPEREAFADFSVPYLNMSGSIFARRGLSGIHRLQDLRGLRVLVHAGSLGERLLIDAGVSNSIVRVESVERAFTLMEQGQGDVTLAARLTGLMTIYRHHLKNVAAVGEPIPGYQVRYCFAVRNGDSDLLARINEGLAILERTGAASQIYWKWFGPVEPRHYSALEIVLAVAIGLALALAAAIWGLLRERSLSRRIAQQEQQLRQAQKLEAIGTLASGIAHDFNNILTSILGHGELIQMDIPPDHPVADSNREILKAAERARKLVRQILSFCRHADAKRELIDITPVVEEALRFIRAAAPSTIEIRHRPESNGAKIEADPTQIHQVLMNLCTNAVQAMRPQPGLLEILEERVRVGPEVVAQHPQLREGDFVRVSVRDTGCGMPPEVLRRIFDPFFTTKAPGEGTGLGLAVVHGILQSHGGAVTVYSRPGEGTLFHLYFPVANPAARPEKEAENAAPPRGRGQLVLFVDDEDSIRGMAQQLIQRLGYKVSVHSNAQEALAFLKDRPTECAVLFTDLTMPGMSGLELIARAREIQPSLPAILASGFLTESDLARAQELQVNRLLDKPITLQALAQALSACTAPHPG